MAVEHAQCRSCPCLCHLVLAGFAGSTCACSRASLGGAVAGTTKRVSSVSSEYSWRRYESAIVICQDYLFIFYRWPYTQRMWGGARCWCFVGRAGVRWSCSRLAQPSIARAEHPHHQHHPRRTALPSLANLEPRVNWPIELRSTTQKLWRARRNAQHELVHRARRGRVRWR